MDLVHSVRRGVSRAQFEVDRNLRQSKAEGAVRAVKNDIRETYTLLGEAVYEGYKTSNAIEVAHYSPFLEKLQNLEQELTKKEAEAAAIKAEVAPVEQEEQPEPVKKVEPVVPAAEVCGPTRRCPRCQVPLRAEAKFCPDCGSRAEEIPSVAPAGRFCPTCKTDVAADILFCPQCGTKTLMQDTPVASPTKCSSCGTELTSDARFCPGCGSAVSTPMPDAAPAGQPTIPTSQPTVEVLDTTEVSSVETGSEVGGDEPPVPQTQVEETPIPATIEEQPTEEVTNLPEMEEIDLQPDQEMSEPAIEVVQETPILATTSDNTVTPSPATEASEEIVQVEKRLPSCPSCGEALTDDNPVFCVWCGTRLAE